MADTDATPTPADEDDAAAVAAESDEQPDTPAAPEDLPLPDYAETAVQAARDAAEALSAAEHAQATKGRMVDKGEADRQTARLQARATYALVELVVGGALTPPVATLESFTFVGETAVEVEDAASGNDDGTADGPTPSVTSGGSDDFQEPSSTDATAKKASGKR